MLLTERQAAREAQIDPRTVRRLILAGRLRAVDVGAGKRRRYRIDPDDLRRIAPPPEATPTTRPPGHRQRRRARPDSEAIAAYLPSA